jgi:4-amino-4-deoxy-L-arabinose transferase-like glycosyltransferase
MSRAGDFLILLVWVASICRGSVRLRSEEEGRRILPAVTMLKTGNYLVPQVGSEPYFRKPPLVNWLVAGSFQLFGARNEWTARLPSVLCVLAVALAFVGLARRSLGPNGAIAAALMWLTNFGLLEKGRMIEIEALYVSLTALAFICWLSWWKERRWLAWTVSGIFLGLGLLAKGPLNLFFFYAVVIAVLWQAGELKRLWSGPHFVGALLMLGIFGAWAIPCLEKVQAGHVANVGRNNLPGGWRAMISSLAIGSSTSRVACYCCPGWFSCPLPVSRSSKTRRTEALPRLVVRRGDPVCRRQSAPGFLPYTTLLAPAIWLLAIFIREHALLWPKPLRKAITWTVVAVTARC